MEDKIIVITFLIKFIIITAILLHIIRFAKGWGNKCIWGFILFFYFLIEMLCLPTNHYRIPETSYIRKCYSNMGIILESIEWYNMDYSKEYMKTLDFDTLISKGYLKKNHITTLNECKYLTKGSFSENNEVNKDILYCKKHGTIRETKDLLDKIEKEKKSFNITKLFKIMWDSGWFYGVYYIFVVLIFLWCVKKPNNEENA